MKALSVATVRNFAVMGHVGTGKTSLVDAFAFKLGLNDKLGSVANGTSVGDFTDEEKARKTTLFSTSFDAPFEHNDAMYRMIFVDTPGFGDFYGQVLGAASACDFALITVDATAGIQAGTIRAWDACAKNGIRAIGLVVTGLDKDGADFAKVTAALRERFGISCTPVVVPDGKGGAIDILETHELPEALREIKAELIEHAAEANDALTEKFLGGEVLTAQEIAQGLDEAVIAGTCHPIFAVNALKDVGVNELLDNICRLMPAPGCRDFTDMDGHVHAADSSAPFVGYVWRSMIDPYLGHLNFIRVVSGTLKPPMEVVDTVSGSRETISAMCQLVGKRQIGLTEAIPGDMVAVAKLKTVTTGHTLAAPGSTAKLPKPDFPKPVTYVAITAHTQADEDKMSVALHRICEAYPTLEVEKNTETKQIVLKGMGDVQIDVAVHIMKTQSNVTVDVSTPKVPYRETVTARGEGHYRHKKQSGGRGQFGEVYLKVEPLPEGDEEMFVNEVVGGAIPGNFIPAVKKGVDDGVLAGPIAGFPVQNVKVRLTDGSYHDVDSSEIAFKIAGSRALRDAVAKARPVLLEPVMALTIRIPETCMGAINGDLTHKRGRVLGLETDGRMQIISAEAPLAELFRYAMELRAATAGQGSFEMSFARYEPVPANLAAKIAAEAAKNKVQSDED